MRETDYDKRSLMDAESSTSEYRFEKCRTEAVVTLVSGETVRGFFFTTGVGAGQDGAERIGDLLNSEAGFFPFEVQAVGGPRTVLYNRSHVIAIQVFDDEARRDPGYVVATRRLVSLLMSNGQRRDGAVRVYRPVGRDRVSDWTRQPETFRYIENDATTFIVNAAHIVSVTEVPGS
jgi:hypothetical protein